MYVWNYKPAKTLYNGEILTIVVNLKSSNLENKTFPSLICNLMIILRVLLFALWVECLLIVQETRVQSQVESYHRLKKWYLMPLCLTLCIIKYGSRVNWSKPGNWVAPSPKPRYHSYWKESLWVTLDYGRQLYFY